MTLSVNSAFYQGLRYRQTSSEAGCGKQGNFDAQETQFDPPPTPQVVSDQEASQVRQWIAPPTPIVGQNSAGRERLGGETTAAPTPILGQNGGAAEQLDGEITASPTPTLGQNGAAKERLGGEITTVPTPTPGQNSDSTDQLGQWLKGVPPTLPVAGNGAATESLSELLANVLNASPPG